jgi:hypothetical protein
MQRKDWLSLLGLKPDASAIDVDEAYRRLVPIWDPNQFANNRGRQLQAERRLQQIDEAYRRLTGAAPPSMLSAAAPGAEAVDVDEFRSRRSALDSVPIQHEIAAALQTRFGKRRRRWTARLSGWQIVVVGAAGVLAFFAAVRLLTDLG